MVRRILYCNDSSWNLFAEKVPKVDKIMRDHKGFIGRIRVWKGKTDEHGADGVGIVGKHDHVHSTAVNTPDWMSIPWLESKDGH
jgi:hypothetical protein